MSQAKESWLKSTNDEKFAAAAMKCQHAGAYCMQDGFCHYEGICFSEILDKIAIEERLETLEIKIDKLLEKNHDPISKNRFNKNV